MEGSSSTASVPLRVLIEKRMRTVISSGLGVYLPAWEVEPFTQDRFAF